MVKKKIAKQCSGIMVTAMFLAVMALAGCSADNAKKPAGNDVQSGGSFVTGMQEGEVIAGISNLGKVNTTAVLIADEHMVNITNLNDIQREAQDIHRMALSHIITTDLDTLIATAAITRRRRRLRLQTG